jgi:predicted DNA-binding transcriptional regulator YafY
VAALLVLQARGRLTAAELATELEVSVKTARRDLEALAIAGIPVYSQAGKGGGWSLLGGARTDLSGLTAVEARTLFMVAGPSVSVAPELKAALRKLVQALPETFRADAEAAASAVIVDPARWGSKAAPWSPHLEALRRAVIDGVQVRLAYAGRGRTETEQTVHPLGIVQKRSTWYLVAASDAGLRTFRVDRVRSVTVSGEPVVRPDGFDLAEAWRSVVATVEERRRLVRALVRVSREVLPMLRDQFGDDLSGARPIEDDGFEVEIAAASVEMLADKLAGWGRDVEVLSPDEVRASLARIGAELVARYGSAPARGTT